MELTVAFHCVNCGRLDQACPHCVNSVHIDPDTGYPPDTMMVDGKAVLVTPDPSAVARSERQAVCDQCATKKGAEAWRLRHEHGCRGAYLVS